MFLNFPIVEQLNSLKPSVQSLSYIDKIVDKIYVSEEIDK